MKFFAASLPALFASTKLCMARRPHGQQWKALRSRAVFFGPANERVNTTDGTKGKAATHVVRHVSEKRVDFIQITKNVSVIRVLWRDRGQVRVLVF